MLVAISLVLPIFGVIGLGYFAARRGFMSPAAIDGLDVYVFTFGIPSLLFRNLAKTELPDTLPWGLWLSFYGAMLSIWAVGYLIGRYGFGRSTPDAIMLGFGGGQGNVVMLGIPIILTGFGDAASVPLFLLLAFHGLILITTATFLLEMTKSRGEEAMSGVEIFMQGLKSSARNPVIIGLGAGILYGQTGLTLPGVVDTAFEMVSRSAIPCALFVLGGTLTRYHLRRSIGAASMTVIMKLVMMPALVFVLSYYVFGLPDLWVAVATVLAGMPTGVYSSILANRYQVAPGAASSAVVLATGLSIVTLTILLRLFLH
ncbi:MAG: AEC family transporter [Rhizobiales bacterium]|nr:AEC family transporter [Hyphomicrobiales bacterium]